MRKTQALCFSLSIRYVAKLAGAWPISYLYSFGALPFIILQFCTTKAKLAGVCPISYPYSFGALPLIFLQLFNYAERGWRKRALFHPYTASERSPFLLLFLSERYTKQFLKSLASIVNILPSGTPRKSTFFISFLSFKPLKIPFR